MKRINLNVSEFNNESANNLPNILNMTESFGTETVINNQNEQKGGFFWSSTGCSENDKKALVAARQKNFAVVCFMVENDMIHNYGTTDEDECTLLHYLVANFNMYNEVKIIKKIINSSDVKNFINKQNKNGDTALLIAVKFGHNALADILVKVGADKSIKNKKGLWVQSSECPSDQAVKSIDVRSDAYSYSPGINLSPVYIGTMSDETAHEVVDDIIKTFFGKNKKPMKMEYSPTTINIDKLLTESAKNVPTTTEDFLNEFLNENKDFKNKYEKQYGGKSKVDTDTLIKELINKYDDDETTMSKEKKHSDAVGFLGKLLGFQKGGEHESPCSFSFNQDFTNNYSFKSNNVKYEYSDQYGGKRRKQKIVKGQRVLNMYKEGVYDNDGTTFNRRQSELSRLINNQATEIHNQVVKTIMELMKVDEETAKVYKAALWRMVKEKFPDVKTNLDKSTEMKQLATKKILKTIDIEKYKKDIQEYRNEKAKNKKTKKINKNKQTTGTKTKTKKTTDTLSETSPGIPTESNFSKTSYMNENDVLNDSFSF